MEYKIYTMPTCDICKEIKEYLKSASIDFTDIDLGDDEGVAELRKIYPKLKDKIERTPDGQLPIPLLIGIEEDEIKQTAHTLDGAKSIVGH